MKVDVITDRKGFDALSGGWNALLRASAADTVFLTWEWISAWLDAVRPDAKLFIIAVRGPDKCLRAVAPFYLSGMGLLGLIRYRCLRVLGDDDSGGEYGDLIVQRGAEQEVIPYVFRALLEHRKAWDCVWMPNVAGWTGGCDRLRALCMTGGFLTHAQPAVFASVPLPGTYETYLGLLSHKRRAYVRRETRRLLASHDVELIRCGASEELPPLLGSLFHLHGLRWRSRGEEGCFARRPAMRRFYEQFAPRALNNGWLALFGLKVDGVVRAVQYGYGYGGRFFALQEGYEPQCDGLGNVLRNLAIKACIEAGLREYDFLGEFSEHKRLWGAEPRLGHSLFFGQRTLRNSILFVPRFRLWPRGRYLIEDDAPVAGASSRGNALGSV